MNRQQDDTVEPFNRDVAANAGYITQQILG